MKKYSRNSVFTKDGELLPIEERTFITNEGYDCIIIDGGSTSGKVTFQIDEYIAETAVHNVKTGAVKNPYKPIVYGIGYYGVGKYKARVNKKDTIPYILWSAMLLRAYSKKYRHLYPTYKDVKVYEEWHNFQVFAEWFYTESNYQEGWHLDKDLLSGESKIYSPTTCIFIPRELNCFMTNVKVTNTSGYTGVRWHKRDLIWEAQIKSVETDKIVYLGRFNTAEKASVAYEAMRTIQCNIWKERMKNILPLVAMNNLR